MARVVRPLRPCRPRSRSSLSKIGCGAAWILFVCACLAFNIGSDNPNIPRWTAIYGLSVLSVVYLAYRTFKYGIPSLNRVNGAVLAFVAYACFSVSISADWREGALRLGSLISLALILLGAQYVNPRRIALGISVVSCIAVLFDQVFPSEIWGGFGNENFLTEFLLIALPFHLFGGVIGILAFIASAWWLFFVCHSDSVWAVAAFYGLAMAVILIVRGKGFLGSLLVLIPLNLAALSGWATGHELFRAISARVELTFNTLCMWLDNPILGWGIGSFNYVYPRYMQRHLEFFPWADTTLRPMTVFAGAAHNEWVQLLAEFGLIGAGIVGAGLWLAFKNLRSRKLRWEDMGALGSLLSASALMCVGFPLHNPHTALLITLALSIAVRPGPSLEPYLSRWPWVGPPRLVRWPITSTALKPASPS